MYYSGITDEAGEAIETQIRVTKELGWSHLELRKVQVKDHPAAMVHDVSEEDFDCVADLINEAGLQVSCFSSAIGNWQKSITDPFDSSLAEAERCISRMKKMGTPYVRMMSFKPICDGNGRPLPLEQQRSEERFRRVKILYDLFTAEGLIPVHENCMNYGGMSWRQTLELVEAVPGLKLVFDTGNPVFADDFSQSDPRPKQSAWTFYEKVREHIAYIHIKDGVWNVRNGTCTFCYPGEGDGDVIRILQDLKTRNYTGGISIEPHMASVFHEDGATERSEDQAYSTFLKYGQRLEKIVAELKGE